VLHLFQTSGYFLYPYCGQTAVLDITKFQASAPTLATNSKTPKAIKFCPLSDRLFAATLNSHFVSCLVIQPLRPVLSEKVE